MKCAIGLSLGVVLLCGPVFATEPAPTTQAAPAKENLVATTNALLRATALALQSRSIEPEERPHFVALLAAADKLRDDKSVAPSERDRLRALARVRLRQASETLNKQIAKQTQVAKPAAKPANTQPMRSQPATIREPAETTLGQQLQLQGLGAGFPGGNPAPGGNANAAELESAKQLMDVITSHIQPESWEDSGGRGVIRYWALGHALVITATSDVHDATADVIEQLR